MVLRANSVAQSLMVDWLSNAPCVSISRTATYNIVFSNYLKSRTLTFKLKITSRDTLNIGWSSNLLTVWFLHHEHLAPGQDARGLPLTAAPPGKPSQRVILPTDPPVLRLEYGGNRFVN